MKLIIYRDKWLRGEGTDTSCLLRSFDQKQCCIGFLCEALGVPREELVKYLASQSLARKFPSLPNWLTNIGSSDLFAAYNANDDVLLSDEDRENRITKIFARHGIEVDFV